MKLHSLLGVPALVFGAGLAFAAGPPILPVSVTNTPANPVPVAIGGALNVSDPQVPFTARLSCETTSGSNSCNATYTVPAGRRVVIQFVAAQCNNGSAGAVYPVPLVAGLLTPLAQFALNLPASGQVFNSNRWYSFSQQVMVHASASSDVNFYFNITDVASVQCRVGLSGYSVSTP